MENRNIEAILNQVRDGTVDVEQAKTMLVQFQDMGLDTSPFSFIILPIRRLEAIIPNFFNSCLILRVP